MHCSTGPNCSNFVQEVNHTHPSAEKTGCRIHTGMSMATSPSGLKHKRSRAAPANLAEGPFSPSTPVDNITDTVGALQRKLTLQRLLASNDTIDRKRAVTHAPSTTNNDNDNDNDNNADQHPDDELQTCSTTNLNYIFFVVLWLSIATFFYNHHNNWTVFESFYYAVQSGLSIGFGVLSEEDDLSRLFTTFHVLCGAVGITVMLSLLSESALANVESKVRLNKLNELLLGTVAESMESPNHSSLLFHICSGCLSIEVLAAMVWFLIGTGAAYVYQDFSLVQSVYFAVTAVSTGGLQGVARNDTSLCATGVYCLIGVPLFGLATSKLATIWLQHRTEEKVKAKLNRECMHQDKFKEYALSLDFVTSPLKRNNKVPEQVMDLSEYLCMELTTLGLVQKEHLKILVDRFLVIDADHSGYITLEEARKSMLVVPQGGGEWGKVVDKKNQ